MRTSNIILLSLFLLICVSALSLALTVRYKTDHDLSTWTIEKERGADRLPSLSEIVIKNSRNVQIQHGDSNSISWNAPRSEAASIYTLEGNVLSVHDSISPGVIITTTRLDKIRFVNEDHCSITNYDLDSLSVVWTPDSASKNYYDDQSLQLMNCNIQRLRLEGQNIGSIQMIFCKVPGLWMYRSDNAMDLNLDHSSVGWIKGSWKGSLSLSMDSTTAQNGIQNIEPLK